MAEQKDWVIVKRGFFYRPDRSGYTANIHEAGLYTAKEAKAEAAIEPDIMSAHPAIEYGYDARQKTVDIEIAVVVGSDGQWAAGGAHRCTEYDWDTLSNTVGEFDKRTRYIVYPDAEHRVIVKATVPIPEKVAKTVQGTAEVVEGDA